MDIQKLVDCMSEEWRKERAASQMTLGAMIDHLSQLPHGAPVQGAAEPHSYRGYYSDLALQPDDDWTTAAKALQMCREALGQKMVGYKGGEFLMTESTPVWLATYGSCGQKILSIQDDGTFELGEDD